MSICFFFVHGELTHQHTCNYLKIGLHCSPANRNWSSGTTPPAPHSSCGSSFVVKTRTVFRQVLMYLNHTASHKYTELHPDKGGKCIMWLLKCIPQALWNCIVCVCLRARVWCLHIADIVTENMFLHLFLP